jgi:ribonuclease HII
MLNHFSKLLESGTDEAGRGCLAGPYSCRGNPSSDFKNTILNDSKQLSEKQERNYALLSSNKPSPLVTHLEPLEIDSINILNASIKQCRNAF